MPVPVARREFLATAALANAQWVQLASVAASAAPANLMRTVGVLSYLTEQESWSGIAPADGEGPFSSTFGLPARRRRRHLAR